MSRRQAKYKLLPLPYAAAELAQRVRPALPQGLRELASADGLTDEQVTQLWDTARTVRGKKPVSLEEWRELYDVVKRFVWNGE
jgi:hypothetical protein